MNSYWFQRVAENSAISFMTTFIPFLVWLSIWLESLLYNLGIDWTEHTTFKNYSIVSDILSGLLRSDGLGIVVGVLGCCGNILTSHVGQQFQLSAVMSHFHLLKVARPEYYRCIAISSFQRRCACDVCDHPREWQLNAALAAMLLILVCADRSFETGQQCQHISCQQSLLSFGRWLAPPQCPVTCFWKPDWRSDC
jgi:hypothetical protein